MPRITLPDGSERQYDAPTTPGQVAADIGPGLAKAALGGDDRRRALRPFDADLAGLRDVARDREDPRG